MTGIGLRGLGARLYHGEASVDIVGRRRTWYAVSLVILLISTLGLFVRQLDLGVEFTGGAVFQVKKADLGIVEVREAVAGQGIEEPGVQQLGNDTIRVQTPEISTEESRQVQRAIADVADVPVEEIQVQLVGPSWGGEITEKALTSLIVFLALVILYLSLALEWKMAAAAIVALLNDLLVTIGVYAIVGFTVTPATIIGVLTILGYSLYDTVVVFDKVKENTRGLTAGSRMSYSQAANLAVNQTLARSINTSLIALLPVAGILFVGAGLLGTGTLKDLALALFIGIAAGTYSSIFIATPFLAQLKEREPAMQALARRAAASQSGRTTAKAAATPVGTPATGAPATGAPATGAATGAPATGAPAAEPAAEATAAGGQAAGRSSSARPARPTKRSGSRSQRKSSGKKRR